MCAAREHETRHQTDNCHNVDSQLRPCESTRRLLCPRVCRRKCWTLLCASRGFVLARAWDARAAAHAPSTRQLHLLLLVGAHPRSRTLETPTMAIPRGGAMHVTLLHCIVDIHRAPGVYNARQFDTTRESAVFVLSPRYSYILHLSSSFNRLV